MDPANVTGKMCTGLQGGLDHHRRRRRLRQQPPLPDPFLIVGEGESRIREFDRRRNSKSFGSN